MAKRLVLKKLPLPSPEYCNPPDSDGQSELSYYPVVDEPAAEYVTDKMNVPLDQACFCVVDVETTGMRAGTERVIEIGIVSLAPGKESESYSSFVNPGKLIPGFITKITGIDDRMVRNAPYFEEIATKVQSYFQNAIFVAHNSQFDYSFIRAEFQQAGLGNFQAVQLCTRRLASRLLPDLKSKSLRSISEHLRIINPAAHRALSDAQTTALALQQMIQIAVDKFQISTLKELVELQYMPTARASKIMKAKKIGADLSGIPQKPGVYYYINRKKKVIYIGKAKSLRERLRSYLGPSAPRKAQKIVAAASQLKIEPTNSELTALLTEAELIKRVNPKHNVMLKDYNDKYFIRISRNSSFPALELTKHFDYDGNDYFGFFISRRKADEMIDILHRSFLLRECDEKELLKGNKCLLADIERCTAPCINADETLYQEELRKVYDFLYGKSYVALERLVKKMKQFSDQLKFEQATEIKTMIDAVTRQVHKSSLLGEPVNAANILIEVSDIPEEKDFILVMNGKVYIRGYLIRESYNFEDALNDYFDHTLFTNPLPDQEDLEKMKIILNWIVLHREKVTIHYLKDFSNTSSLIKKVRGLSQPISRLGETSFDINDLINKED